MTDIDFGVADRLMREFFDTGGTPGVAYGVVRDGELVHEGGLGVDRIDGDVPDSSSVFRIASMSKSFVAATVIALRDEGLVSLEAPIATYVPELEGVRGPTLDSPAPTVRDLLTMSPGWVTDDPWADRNESMAPQEFSRLLAAGLVFDDAPGLRFEYSNLAYTILGRLITNLAGRQFQDVVTEQVLRPLGMSSTGFTLADVPEGRLADGHFRRDGSWHVEPTSDTGEFAALGGLFSSVADLARWVGTFTDAFPARDSDDPRIPLSRASLREMQQAHRFITAVRGIPGDDRLPGVVDGQGFGLVVSVHPRFGTLVHHGGGYPGYGTHMIWHPQSGLGVVGLANARYTGPYRATGYVLSALLEQLDAPARVIRPSVTVRAAQAAVDGLLETWDDAVADALFAPNVDGDLPRELRAAEVRASVDAVGGLVGPAYDVVAKGTSRLVWWRPGEHGRLRAEVWLTPELPQRIQTMNVRGVPDPDARLVVLAAAVLESLVSDAPGWPAQVSRGDNVDVEALLAEGRRARAAGVATAVDPLPTAAASAYDATFEARGPEVRATLAIAMDADTGAVTTCRMTVSGDEWPTAVVTDLEESVP